MTWIGRTLVETLLWKKTTISDYSVWCAWKLSCVVLAHLWIVSDGAAKNRSCEAEKHIKVLSVCGYDTLTSFLEFYVLIQSASSNLSKAHV